MRVRVRLGAYDAVGTAVRNEGAIWIVEPDEKPAIQYLFEAMTARNAGREEIAAFARRLGEIGCVDPSGERATCIPVPWNSVELANPQPGDLAVWDELVDHGDVLYHGNWPGTVVEVQESRVLLRMPRPLSAIEGLDVPFSIIIEPDLPPEYLHPMVTEISRPFYDRWKRSGRPVPPGRIRHGRTTQKFFRTRTRDWGPIETEAFVLSRPVSMDMLYGECIAQGESPPIMGCVGYGGRFILLPLDRTEVALVRKALRPPM